MCRCRSECVLQKAVCVCVGGGGLENDICGNAYLTTEMEVGEVFDCVDFVKVGFWMKIREDTS